MTSKGITSPLPVQGPRGLRQPIEDRLFTIAFGAVQWPWLLRGLYGGTKAEKARLLRRLDLPLDALPNLGSWKADTHLLHRLVDLIKELRPATIVELGAGATTLVLARALQMNCPEARLVSFDQNAGFIASVAQWLREYGLSADLRHAPLCLPSTGWPGYWYKITDAPNTIDMLVVDGPPWSVHPLVRGAAEQLFSRIPAGGVIVLDDASRPGEKMIARRWQRDWPNIRFRNEKSGKGTLIGVNV